MIKFKCSNCNHGIGAPEKYAGKRVRCPKCKAPIQVPESAEKTDTQKPGLIKFHCPTCNQKIGVSLNYAGKSVRCARCKNPLRVPQAPGQARPPGVKDETAVLRAGQEQRSADQADWGNMEGMDELLAAEVSAPSLERHLEPGPVDYPAAEDEFSEDTGRLSQQGAFAERAVSPARPGKKRSAVLVGAGCVLLLLVVGVVIWFSLADSGTGESQTQEKLPEVKEFAEDYIGLLNKGEINNARELLSPELQSDVEESEFEKLAKCLGKSDIEQLDCRATGSEEYPEGNQFYLCYNIRYEQDEIYSLVVSVSQIDEELSVAAIAVREPFGNTISIGPQSYEELSTLAFAATFEKIGSIFARFFCGFVIVMIVLGLVQVIAMWIVFDKAGHPGWAAIVPFYNAWVLAEVGDKPGWLGLAACFCGAIPFIGLIVQFILWMVISIGVARSFNRGVIFGIGLTFVPFVFFPILAFATD